MRRVILFILGIIFLVAAIRLGTFVWKNFSGVLPAVKPPAQDIEKILQKPIKNAERAAENNTQLPLKIPVGFSLSIFANNLGNPRVIVFDPVGNLLVSIPSQGRIVALPDLNHDGIADEPLALVENLNKPHGLAFRCDSGSAKNCQLYVAETDGVSVYDYTTDPIRAFNGNKIIDLPGGGNHFSRTLLFDQNKNKLFIAVGSSCNACVEKDWRRAKILTANPDGTDLKVYASGLRNAVFMANHPVTKTMWVTEMGRDFLGDDLPPDEINIIKENGNFGWPYCYGKNILDKDFDPNKSCDSFESSHIDIPAHSAPLGLAFFPEKGWPQEFRYNLLVAYHGSWNRTQPTGYKIVRYRLDREGNYLGEEDFVSGWLQGGEALGRPVDILISDKGTIYISDDKAGLIYRMEYLK